jgi:pimeloyl-ACP methyl ester carboxylesterase
MLKIVPLLTNPAAHGMPNTPSFHVVVASLPGYGFSDAGREPGLDGVAMAKYMSGLMTDVLGYQRYGVRGSDIGAMIIDQMMRDYPEQIIGAHLTGIILPGLPSLPNPTKAEQAFFAAGAAMGATEMSYARQHASKPQTLAYGLTDSPVGLAGWIVEKYRSWGDTHGDIESRFSKDYLLTTLTTYWVTNTINPSIRIYYEMGRTRGTQPPTKSRVPVGMLMTTRDVFPAAPRELGERFYNIVHWEETDNGGHFLEWEEPELVARDIQSFFGQL